MLISVPTATGAASATDGASACASVCRNRLSVAVRSLGAAAPSLPAPSAASNFLKASANEFMGGFGVVTGFAVSTVVCTAAGTAGAAATMLGTTLPA